MKPAYLEPNAKALVIGPEHNPHKGKIITLHKFVRGGDKFVEPVFSKEITWPVGDPEYPPSWIAFGESLVQPGYNPEHNYTTKPMWAAFAPEHLIPLNDNDTQTLTHTKGKNFVIYEMGDALRPISMEAFMRKMSGDFGVAKPVYEEHLVAFILRLCSGYIRDNTVLTVSENPLIAFTEGRLAKEITSVGDDYFYVVPMSVTKKVIATWNKRKGTYQFNPDGIEGVL